MRYVLTAIVFCGFGFPCPCDAAAPYDPLQKLVESVDTIELIVIDQGRNREIPVKVYRPRQTGAASTSPAPVVLFSHGLGGSREGSPFLGEHWAARGYVAVFLQHPGSDVDVWRGKPLAERRGAMQQAAGLENFRLRTEDVRVVLDQLTSWNTQINHALAKSLQMEAVGMAGHSFGAVTTQAVSGQSFRQGKLFTDDRIKAAIAMSPSTPKRGNAEDAFSKVSIPWLLMTGTHDTSPIGDQDVASRLGVFPALPKGQKFELVLDQAEHSVFTDRKLPGESRPRNPNHHKAIVAISTAFWDMALKSDREAQAWLEGEGARGVLEPKDSWQFK